MNPSEFEQLKTREAAVMLYFYNDVCGVCHSLWPKVENMIKTRFPKILINRVNASDSLELAGQLQMLSVPGILLYLEGREYYRGNGMVSIQEMEAKILRPYSLMFEN